MGSKSGQRNHIHPRLSSLPPTTEALAENVKRAIVKHQYGNVVWNQIHHRRDLLENGWRLDDRAKSRVPRTVAENVPLAPPYFKLQRVIVTEMNLVKLQTTRWGCCRAKLPCTLFCACQGDVRPSQQWSVIMSNDSSNDVARSLCKSNNLYVQLKKIWSWLVTCEY